MVKRFFFLSFCGMQLRIEWMLLYWFGRNVLGGNLNHVSVSDLQIYELCTDIYERTYAAIILFLNYNKCDMNGVVWAIYRCTYSLSICTFISVQWLYEYNFLFFSILSSRKRSMLNALWRSWKLSGDTNLWLFSPSLMELLLLQIEFKNPPLIW